MKKGKVLPKSDSISAKKLIQLNAGKSWKQHGSMESLSVLEYCTSTKLEQLF